MAGVGIAAEGLVIPAYCNLEVAGVNQVSEKMFQPLSVPERWRRVELCERTYCICNIRTARDGHVHERTYNLLIL